MNILNIESNKESDDSLSVVNLSNFFTISGLRSDVDRLLNNKLFNGPGIYMLWDTSRVYVGQSAVSIQSRISKHLVNKNNWTNFACFGFVDGSLSKGQADYLETYLIKLFNQKSAYITTNKTIGNTSFISDIDENSSIDLVRKARAMLLLVDVNVLPELESVVTLTNDPKVKITSHAEVVSGYNTIVFPELNRLMFQGTPDVIFTQMMNYFYNLSDDYHYYKLSTDIVDDAPTATSMLGRYMPALKKNGKSRAILLSGRDDVYLYIDMSKDEITKAISYYAELLNTPVDFLMKV